MAQPSRIYLAKNWIPRLAVPIFEPYKEALPLESGSYTFVIDDRSRFRVVRGNASSHAGMADGKPAGSAGHFWMTRAGKVGRVVCVSRDYKILVPHDRDPTVKFTIEAFERHFAFDLSKYAYFKFSKSLTESFHVSADGSILEDPADMDLRQEGEGRGPQHDRPFSTEQVEAFGHYRPVAPETFYPIHDDQQEYASNYGEEERGGGFVVGPFAPRYSPESKPLQSGKVAFVIDGEGWLILGNGHHILAGCNPVGSAGQLEIDEDGEVVTINLNFSGHYRPPFSAAYARFTYHCLATHPLLTFASECKISARQCFDINERLKSIDLSPSMLLPGNLELEELLGEDEERSFTDEPSSEGESPTEGDFNPWA